MPIGWEIREDDASRRFLAASEARTALAWWPYILLISVLSLAGMFLVGTLEPNADSLKSILPFLPFGILLLLIPPILAAFYWIAHRLLPGSHWSLGTGSVVLRGRDFASIPYAEVAERVIHPIHWPPGYREYLLARRGGDVYRIVVGPGPDLERFEEELERRTSPR